MLTYIPFPNVLLILQVCFAQFEQEQCSTDRNRDCGVKYSLEANKYSKYLEKIHEAEKLFQPCQEPNCKCYQDVLEADLKPFGTGITQRNLEITRSKGTKYQIINRRVYREINCMFPSRCAGIEHFLLKLAPKLPDTEMVINTRDWPQAYRNYARPVFSFSKTAEYADIMYPAWAFWEGGPAIGLYPKGIGRWDKHRTEISKAANETAWDDKINKAFFRGSRTSSDRDPLILLSRERPDLVNANYTKNQAWKSNADTLDAPPAYEIDFPDHCQYKYLFNFRGVAASFRLKHILLCKSLVFHVGDEWIEFFYPLLKPWYHYIPVPADARKHEIEELIEFVKAHDDVALRIATNGFEFVWNRLRMTDVECYWKKLIRAYTKLFKFKPVLDPNLIEITSKQHS